MDIFQIPILYILQETSVIIPTSIYEKTSKGDFSILKDISNNTKKKSLMYLYIRI